MITDVIAWHINIRVCVTVCSARAQTKVSAAVLPEFPTQLQHSSDAWVGAMGPQTQSLPSESRTTSIRMFAETVKNAITLRHWALIACPNVFDWFCLKQELSAPRSPPSFFGQTSAGLTYSLATYTDSLQLPTYPPYDSCRSSNCPKKSRNMAQLQHSLSLSLPLSL